MFAVLPDIDASFVPWLTGFAILIFLLNQGFSFYKTHVREEPRPADTYATKKEHSDLKRHVDTRLEGMQGELKGTVERINATREENARRLEEKIDSLRKESDEDNDGLEKKIEALRDDCREDIKGVHKRCDLILTHLTNRD